ncbi:hypothetical protein ARSEF1564_009176 [Beauveria bassiana]
MGSCASPNLQGPPTKAWEALSPLLPPRGPDCDYWWNLTGIHLAALVDAAGYPIEKQYEALLFHHTWTVPYLGPAPTQDGSFAWPTVMNLSGLPIEYSWKWNIGKRVPEIRYTIDAKGRFTGTATDPLNQEASHEMLHHLQRVLPGVNLEWTNHFFVTLFDRDRYKYYKEATAGVTQYTTTVMIAAEFKPSGLTIKTYFSPRRLGMERVPLARWKEAIDEVCPGSAASDILYDFLNDPEGKLLHPAILGLDATEPAKSRLKFYFRSPNMSFRSIREIMTLGGRKPVTEEQLQALQSLIAAVADLEQDFPDDSNLAITAPLKHQAENASTATPLVYPACGYYFNIARGLEQPEVKVCIPLYVYGPDDGTMARGITSWMETHGRGEYCQRYLSMLQSLSERRRLDGEKGIQTYLSCMFKEDGELEITSYLTPVLRSLLEQAS